MITEDGEGQDQAGTERRCPTCGAPAADAAFAFCTSCGARLDAAAAEGKSLVSAAKDGDKAVAVRDPLDAEDTEGSWLARHRKLVVIGAAAVLVVGAGSYVGWQYAGFRTADGPVEVFFQALEDRDPAAAAAVLADASFYDESDASAAAVLGSPIWQDGALDTGYTPPALQGVEVDYFMGSGEVDQRPDKSLARAVATFALGDAVFATEFLMAREVEGVNREWSIASVPMGTLPVSGWHGEVRAANATVTDAPYVPPGIYEVEVAGNALFAAAEGQVVIGGEDHVEGPGGGADPGAGPPAGVASTAPPPGDGGEDLFPDEAPLDSMTPSLIVTSTVGYELRPKATEEVESQIRALIDGCALPHRLDLETCPFTLVNLDELVGHSVGTALEGGSEWTVDAYPEIALVVGEGGQVRVQVLEAGHATGEYLGPADGIGLSLPWDSYEAELSPWGPVRAEGDSVVWTYTP